MPIRRIGDDASGRPRWIRSPFRPEDYVPSARTLDELRTYYPAGWSVESMLADHGGAFWGFVLVDRFRRDGQDWIRLFDPAREIAVDVEALPNGVGEIRATEPDEVWKLVRQRDVDQLGDRVVVGDAWPDASR